MAPSSGSRRSWLGRTVGTGLRAGRLFLRGTLRSGRWVTRGAGQARTRGAGGDAGMVRLFDLHALSCAGDTLIAIGLASTIFFSVPLGEARSKVALYLLVTMVPFALLAPVVGPLLDRFRHGRRYALAVTMLGRAFLAWAISGNLDNLWLYPAAFGVLALSRAYGVARSAAVPRLLPEGLGLSQVNARASLYGTVAGALVAPIGLAAFWFGPQWPVRVAAVVFVVGMVIALRLPPRADSDPPESVPHPLRSLLRRGGERPLGRGRPQGRLVIATLVGAAVARGSYGFLLLFLAFAVKAGDLAPVVAGRDIGAQAALGVVGAGLGAGTFLATAVGTRLRIRRPTALQAGGMILATLLGALATVRFSLPAVAAFCLVTALVSGLAKLAVDASIAERLPERLRASSFAHSETVLMLAFVAGGALGLLPVGGRVGVGVAAGVAALAAIRCVMVTVTLRGQTLRGSALTDEEWAEQEREAAESEREAAAARDTSATRDHDTSPDRDRDTSADQDRDVDAARAAAPVSPATTGQSALDDDEPTFHIYRPSPVGGARPGAVPPGQDKPESI